MTMKQTLFLGLTLGSLAACQTTPPSSFNVVEGDARQTCQVKKAFETTAFGADFEAEADRLMAHMTERNIAPERSSASPRKAKPSSIRPMATPIWKAKSRWRPTRSFAFIP